MSCVMTDALAVIRRSIDDDDSMSIKRKVKLSKMKTEEILAAVPPLMWLNRPLAAAAQLNSWTSVYGCQARVARDQFASLVVRRQATELITLARSLRVRV